LFLFQPPTSDSPLFFPPPPCFGRGSRFGPVSFHLPECFVVPHSLLFFFCPHSLSPLGVPAPFSGFVPNGVFCVLFFSVELFGSCAGLANLSSFYVTCAVLLHPLGARVSGFLPPPIKFVLIGDFARLHNYHPPQDSMEFSPPLCGRVLFFTQFWSLCWPGHYQPSPLLSVRGFSSVSGRSAQRDHHSYYRILLHHTVSPVPFLFYAFFFLFVLPPPFSFSLTFRHSGRTKMPVLTPSQARSPAFLRLPNPPPFFSLLDSRFPLQDPASNARYTVIFPNKRAFLNSHPFGTFVPGLPFRSPHPTPFPFFCPFLFFSVCPLLCSNALSLAVPYCPFFFAFSSVPPRWRIVLRYSLVLCFAYWVSFLPLPPNGNPPSPFFCRPPTSGDLQPPPFTKPFRPPRQSPQL